MPTPVPSEKEVIRYMDTLSNWGRWGPDDELGTLNFITPEKRQRAAQLVRDGVTVTCSRPIVTDITADTTFQPMRFMVDSGEGRDTDPPERILERRCALDSYRLLSTTPRGRRGESHSERHTCDACRLYAVVSRARNRHAGHRYAQRYQPAPIPAYG